MEKKAQAASEFSITSTFSLIAIFVILGGMWYFGIFGFINMMPKKCVLPAGISCVDQKITQNEASFVLMNNLGSDIVVESIRMNACEPSQQREIRFGDMQTFNLNCSLSKGPLKTVFYVDFKNKRTNLDQTWEGEYLTAVP